MRPDAVLRNPTVVKELIKSGGKITDWQKMTTPSVKLSTGQKVQVHFYQNKITGAINYAHQDFKVKGIVDLFPKLPLSEPMVQPPYRFK